MFIPGTLEFGMNFVLLLLVNGFLLNVESYSNRYTPNPRAVHPDGRLPTITQAKKKVHNIRQKIFSPTSPSKVDGEDPTLNIDPTIILVDGNNIRNSFGFQAVSALQLTKKLSCWSRTGGVSHGDSHGVTGTGGSILEDNNNTPLSSTSTSSTPHPHPQIICVWDGGSDVISQRAGISGLTAFSGSVGNADDLIVQCCAFLSQPHICPPRKKRTIVVFTSDANLANRCKLQLLGEGRLCSSRIDCQFYHSIYLRLLLEDEDGTSTGTCSSNSSSSSSLDTFAPDWEREERRNSVQKLQSFLESVQEVRVDDNHEPMNCICEWINNGLGGLEIGRVTKGGSILYQMKD